MTADSHFVKILPQHDRRVEKAMFKILPLFLPLCELKIESTSFYIPWFPMGTLFWGPMGNRRGNPPVVNILKPVGVLC